MIPPVEMQGIIQRSHDVTQIKSQEDAGPEQQHNIITAQQEKMITRQHEAVVKQNNTEKKQDRDDPREKTHGIYYSAKKKRKGQKGDEDGKVVMKNKIFDVKV